MAGEGFFNENRAASHEYSKMIMVIIRPMGDQILFRPCDATKPEILIGQKPVF